MHGSLQLHFLTVKVNLGTEEFGRTMRFNPDVFTDIALGGDEDEIAKDEADVKALADFINNAAIPNLVCVCVCVCVLRGRCRKWLPTASPLWMGIWLGRCSTPGELTCATWAVLSPKFAKIPIFPTLRCVFVCVYLCVYICACVPVYVCVCGRTCV